MIGGWKAELGLAFSGAAGKTTLARKTSEGPLVVQKPLYPEGPQVCHAIVVHPPGGIAGGDELRLEVDAAKGASALLTTPGAAKWYRTRGPLASQALVFRAEGAIEWLPRETIVFDGADASLEARIDVAGGGTFIGWELICLGRRGSGEAFHNGRVKLHTEVRRDGRLLFVEKGRVEGDGPLLASPVGLGARSVFGTMVCVFSGELGFQRSEALALTRLPGVLVARYLGDSSEEALVAFGALWTQLRPQVLGRAACEPRIWRT